MPDRHQCIVVDDEFPARQLIATHLEQLPQFELVASCGDAIEASQVLAQRPIDLMFLDIEMPTIKGTDFYQSLRQPPAVIFTTAYRDHAALGFDLEATDYLLKPILFSRFFKATQRFLASKQGTNQEVTSSRNERPTDIFIRVDRQHIRLSLDEVFYVRSMGDYQQIHTRTARYMVKATMSDFARRLGTNFVKTHRSYLVNKRHISSVSRGEIRVMESDLPVSATHRDAVLMQLGLTDK